MICWRSGGEPEGLLSRSSFAHPRPDAIHLPKLPFGAIRPFCTFLNPLGIRRHFLLTSSAVIPAFSTLLTTSTLLALHCLGTSLIWRDLASRRFWYASCLLEKMQSRD